MINFCLHNYSNYSAPYNSTIVRSRGDFGKTSVDDVVCQERTCSKCNKVKVEIIRSGKINDKYGNE